MTPREQRAALLGEDVITQIHDRVALAPAPGPDVTDDLRRILTRPASRTTATVPAPRAA
ncbi:hypothetical protein [Streptomyces sp. BE230]|uniref:hypothetical protein n=1 Tax=Streptomyces sp. BE230 TaxID=3002526 RepID=UPI002ED46C70|nr:hypothetical protein [Streptomyces sp. BE230]